MFQNNLITSRSDAFTADRQKAPILNYLGAEGQRMFYTLPEHTSSLLLQLTGANEFDQGMCKLNSRFAITLNVIVEISRFHKKDRNPMTTSVITLLYYPV